MNRSSLIIAGAVAAVVVTAVVLFQKEEPADEAPPVQANTVEAASQARAVTPSDVPPSLTARTGPPSAASAAAAEPPQDDISQYTEIKFQADAKGRMVANERARLNLEKLFALYTPAERQKKLDELSADLPQAAARDLADLMERYINYDAAQRQTFPPGQDLSSPEEGLNMIDNMHNLRVQHFGADVANSFFGKEEKIQRELLRLMSMEKDGSMTLEEKAERAQALYQSQMPETAAELAAGRKQSNTPPPKAN